MNDTLRFVIITGMSGAGKTLALRHLEDLGYFCVDNLPPALISKFAELCNQSEVQRVAVVMDIRGGEFFDSLTEALCFLKCNNYHYEILFLEADDETLIRRYKEVRRQHPLSGEGSILEGITAERNRLSQLRERADLVLDTSFLTPQRLREELQAHYAAPGWKQKLNVRVISFGFKHGLPLDADLVFDERFLPNPYYVPELRPQPGTTDAVREYVLKWPLAQEFLDRIVALIEWLIPHYIDEGKRSLVIAIGCTGGRHRSVVIANRLRELLQSKHDLHLQHRDITLGGTQ
ncbi:MAG: RNase adapter RapZ [Firmicutes bacterium]|nr:RNase adapter RapZ [Bacillota bacterium]